MSLTNKSEKSSAPPPARRRNRTRDALLTAGAALLAERPIDALSIDDIVHAAGVAKGSFYNHFADKTALAIAIGDSIRSDVVAMVAAANRDVADPAVRLAHGLCIYVDFARHQTHRASIMARNLDIGRDKFLGATTGLRQDLAAGLASGRFVLASVDAGTVFFMGVAHAALERILVTTGDSGHAARRDAATLAQQQCAMVLKGLGLPHDESDRIAAQSAHVIIAAQA